MDTRLAELLRRWTAPQGEPPKPERWSTSAGIPLAPWYGTPEGEVPGGYPFTRGISTRGYLDQAWVMGQYSGYASPKDTNQRFRDLLAAGQTGLSIALDLPTQLGMDSDNPLAEGEVGKVGVPIDSVEDLVLLLDGLPLERVRQVRTSANAIGPMFAALFQVALEELGVSPRSFRLMLQNDPLKEFPARGAYIFTPRSSLKLAVDVIEHFATEHPHWEPIEFCGYHIRDAGGTAVHEVATATANGIAYLDEATRRGVDIDGLAHTLFVFLSAGPDIFEEAAKLRAARRLWARLLHERYGVRQERAGVNLFVYTLGGALVAPEPLNNVVRVAYESLAAVLAGVQTLATSSFDEALGLPSTAAARLALRTQQILAYEAGAALVADPLGGSHYVEALTDALDGEICRFLLRIVELGGAVAALESGFIHTELADAAYRLQQEIEAGTRPIVTVNVFKSQPDTITQVLRVPDGVRADQVDRLIRLRAEREPRRVDAALHAVRDAASQDRNTIPPLIEAARARATLGEMVAVLSGVYARQPAVGFF